jgi:hypothetical protein
MDRAYSPTAEKVKTLIERRYSRGRAVQVDSGLPAPGFSA